MNNDIRIYTKNEYDSNGKIINKQGDIFVTESGDIQITNSVLQEVIVRLKWIKNEWRLGPDYGFPYFEELLVKNPNLAYIGNLIANEVREVAEVNDVQIIDMEYNSEKRVARFVLDITINDEIHRQEVELNG